MMGVFDHARHTYLRDRYAIPIIEAKTREEIMDAILEADKVLGDEDLAYVIGGAMIEWVAEKEERDRDQRRT